MYDFMTYQEYNIVQNGMLYFVLFAPFCFTTFADTWSEP